MDYLSHQNWTFPVPIRYGPGRIKELSEICKNKGIKKPLVVTDNGSKNLKFIENILNDLEDHQLKPGLFSNISPNPRDTEILEGKLNFNNGNYDGIIAIGGGSGMDGGKSISLVANNDYDILDFEWEKKPPKINKDNKFPPLICIPTTAGTGAETESSAMVTDTKLFVKWCIAHPKQKPIEVILDPELTLELPKNLTAWTGVDALVHAIEAYVIDDFHPLCDASAIEGLRLIYPNLPNVYSDPSNLVARGKMLVGSCLAGISFLKGLGFVHAISHMVGAEFDTQHGLTNAIVLPAVLRFNEKVISEKVPIMCQAMNLKNKDFDYFYQSICELLNQLDIPKNLKDIGIKESSINSLSKKALTDSAFATNPRTASLQEMKDIISQSIFEGR
jgi:alcohol dehydrogenase class IV